MAKKKKSSKPAPPPPRHRTPRAARNATAHDPIELIARGVWIHGSRVLLCRSVKKGYLYLPGGHIEFGESAARALEREFLEETNVAVRARELLLASEGSFSTGKRAHHEINLVFRAEPKSPTAAPKPPKISSAEPEITFEWIDLAAAVDLDIRPLAIKAFLAAGPGETPLEWVSEFADR